MIIEILFVVDMFLWFLTVLPVAQLDPFRWSNAIFAWIAVLLLGLSFYGTGLGIR